MANLQQRLRLHRRRRSARRLLMGAMKRQLVRLSACLLALTMLMALVNLPDVYAYFTGLIRSELLMVEIRIPPNNPSGQANANANFRERFLVEDTSTALEEGSSDDGMALFSTEGGTELDSGEQESELALASAHQLLHVTIQLEDGFSVYDTYIPSIQLIHDRFAATALAGWIDNDGALVVSFDAAEVTSWFGAAVYELETVTLTVTGDGYVEGLYHFHFAGQASISLLGTFETQYVDLAGSDQLYIPQEAAQVTKADYQLVDQERTPVSPVAWSIGNLPKGVSFDAESGRLTVDSSAQGTTLTITGVTEQEGRVLSAHLNVQLLAEEETKEDKADEAPEEEPAPKVSSGDVSGPFLLLIPGDEKVIEATYQVLVDGEVQPDAVWELALPAEGVSLTSQGVLMVSGEAGAASLELVASWEGVLVAEHDGDEDADTENATTALHAYGTVVLAHPAPSSITISGPSVITIPDADDEGAPVIETRSVAAVVRDQEGNALPDESVLLSLASEVSGVSLDGEEGQLHISSEAEASTLALVATSKTDATVTAQLLIELKPSEVEGIDGEDGDGDEDGESLDARKEEEETSSADVADE